jgi:O-antigen/teichoic acid export membrane protein
LAGTVDLPLVRRRQPARAAAVSDAAQPEGGPTPHEVGGRVREGLKRLSADTAVYGRGQVGSRAVQLLLVPILTRALSPQAFGVGELVIGYAQTVVLILVFGMDGALARHFYGEPDREAKVRMVSSSLVFRLATSCAAAALLALLAAPLAGRFMGGEVYRKYVLIGAATLPFTLLSMFANDVLRVTFQPWKFIVLNTTQTVLVATTSLWLVVGRDLGVAGVLYGRLAGDAGAALLGLVLIRHNLAPRFSGATLRRLLAYGAPMLPAAFGFAAIAGIDRYALQATHTLEELARYALAMKCFTVMTIAASAFQLAYGPFVFARAGTPEAPRLYARVFSAYVATGALGALLFGAFAPELIALAAPAAYAGAALPALLLAFAAVALGTYTVSSIGIGLALRTPLLGWCSGGGALVAILAHAALTPRYGAPGAAIATLLGYAAAAVITFAVAQRVHPLPFRGRRAAVLFAVALALGLAAQRLLPATAAGAAGKLLVAGGFAWACVRLGVWMERRTVARER